MSVGELTVSIIGDMSKLSETFSKVQTNLGDVGSKISSVGQTMSSAGSAMTSGITVPLAAVSAGIGVTVNAATDFDTGMRRVATMLPGITDSAFTDISNQALDLSTQFGSSTTEMTDAMYQALSSGIPQDNIFSFMQTAEQLAIGGATDVVTSTDVLTTAVNSYGEANLSAAEASDILFQGTKFGKSTVEELASTLANVVPIAASLGIGFDDVNASLATMTIQGTPTAQATTQLRSMMDELSDKNSDVAASFKYFTGQSFPEFIAAGGTMGGAVQILNDHIGEMVPNMAKVASAEEKLNKPTSEMAKDFEKIAGKSFAEFVKGGGTVTQALDMMGISYGSSANKVSDYFSRIEAGTGAIQLATDNGNLYKQSLDGMGESAGATAEAYKTMSEGMGASWDKIKASVEVLMIKIGQELVPVIADTFVPLITETLIPGIEAVVPIIGTVAGLFGALPGSIQIAIVGFLAFVAALGPVLIIAGSIASGIGAIAGLFGAGGALAGAFAFAQTAIAGVVAALGTFALPITLIIGAVTLLAVAWKNNWFDIQGKFEAAKTVITTTATNLYNTLHLTYNSIIMSIGTLKTNLKTIWDLIAASFSASKTLIVNTVTGLYNGLVSVYNTITSAGKSLLNYWKTHWNSVSSTSVTAASVIPTSIGSLHSNLLAKYNLIKNAGTALYNAWSKHWSSVNTAMRSASSLINSALGSLVSYITSKYNSIKSGDSGFLSATKTHWNNILNTVKTAGSNVNGALGSLLSYVTTKYNSLKSGDSGYLSSTKTHWNNMWTTVKTAGTNINSALSSLLSYITSKYNSIKSENTGLFNAITTIWTKIVSSVKSAGSNLISAVSGIPGDIKALASSFSKAGEVILDALYDSIVSGFNKAIKKAKSMLSDLKDLMPNSPAKTGPFHVLPNWDTAIYDPLNDSISKVGGLSAPLSKALSGIRNPIDVGMSTGLQNVSTVSNSTTVEGSKYSIGPNYVRSDTDLDAIISAVKSSIANDRRRAGIF